MHFATFQIHRYAVITFQMICILCLLALMSRASSVATAQDLDSPADVRQFLANNCYDCHSGKDSDGGLDLKQLSDEYRLENKDRWVRIFDRVHAREMPPTDYGEIDARKRQDFLKSTRTWIESVQQQEYEQKGRVKARRLTNLQLERTLHDLLGIDIPLKRRMPTEPRTGAFYNVADGQPMSHFHLQQHLDVVDAALDEAFERALVRNDEYKFTNLSAEKIARSKARRRTREPELINGRAVVWSSRLVFYGRVPATRVKESGWYQFKIKAKGLKVPNKKIWCTIRSGECVSSAPFLDWVDSFEIGSEDRTISVEAWIPENHMLEIRPGDITLKQARFAGGQAGTGEGGPQNVPGLAIHSIEMKRIYQNGDDDQVREKLFGNLEIVSDKNKRTKQRRVKTQNPKSDIATQMHRFAQFAFRRGLKRETIQRYIDLALDVYQSDQDFVSALKSGYRSLLCSPRFLFLQEQPGELDDYAIASRLSYLIWNRMPDHELLKLATTNQLSDRSVIREQVNRMLNDPKGKDFVRDLADQWLDLELIDFTEPDLRLYPGFDSLVQNAMLDETYLFLQWMLDKDLSVSQLVLSDKTFLNSRLAAYYKIPNVKGEKMKLVDLPAETPYGGLLTQGAIMKVTANGTTTSPVIRGVWVSERLLGEEISPPPENVPAIEPDIRGAKTIREQLAKHKSNTECASCHRSIDPPGFALENFDPSGRWRENYTTRRGKKKTQLPIDSGYQMPNGERFDGIQEFKKLVIKDRKKLARNVAEKLLVYGTGETIQFVDRPVIESIVENTKESRYGLRSILIAVVTSETFLTK